MEGAKGTAEKLRELITKWRERAKRGEQAIKFQGWGDSTALFILIGCADELEALAESGAGQKFWCPKYGGLYEPKCSDCREMRPACPLAQPATTKEKKVPMKRIEPEQFDAAVKAAIGGEPTREVRAHIAGVHPDSLLPEQPLPKPGETSAEFDARSWARKNNTHHGYPCYEHEPCCWCRDLEVVVQALYAAGLSASRGQLALLRAEMKAAGEHIGDLDDEIKQLKAVPAAAPELSEEQVRQIETCLDSLNEQNIGLMKATIRTLLRASQAGSQPTRLPQDLVELSKRATAGPWKYSRWKSNKETYIRHGIGNSVGAGQIFMTRSNASGDKIDWQFIVACVNYVRAQAGSR